MTRCGFCNFSAHPRSVHEWCPRGEHPLDIVGQYRYGKRERCKGCARDDARRYHARKPWKAERRRRRHRRRQERREQRARRAAERNERARDQMCRWAEETFGYDPESVRRMADLLAELEHRQTASPEA